MAWIVGTYADRQTSSLKGRQLEAHWRRWQSVLEHAFRLCSEYAWNGRLTGIVGITEARKTPLVNGSKVPLEVEAASAFEPAYYGASFRLLRLAKYRSQSGSLLALTPAGEELFAAFDTALRMELDASATSSLGRLLSAPSELRSEDLIAISHAFRLRPLAPDDPEHGALVSVLMPLAAEAHHEAALPYAAHARSLGLGLTLSLYEAGGGQLSAHGLIEAIATRQAPNGKAIVGNTPFEETLESWFRYMERQFQKRALDAFWRELLVVLQHASPDSVPAEVIVRRLLSFCADSAVLRKYLGTAALERTLEDAITTAENEVGTDPRSGVMWELFQIGGSSDSTATERLGAAVVLLLGVLASWRMNSAEISPFQTKMHWHGGPPRLVLPWMASEASSRGQRPLSEFIRWLIEWCVIAQANRVAFQKLGDGDRFVIRWERGGCRLTENVPTYLTYLALDANRLSGATSLLLGLELLSADAADHTIRITKTGRRVVKQLGGAALLSTNRRRTS